MDADLRLEERIDLLEKLDNFLNDLYAERNWTKRRQRIRFESGRAVAEEHIQKPRKMILDIVVEEGCIKRSRLDAAKRKIFWIEFGIDCINEVVVVVYRLLRPDEEWTNGLRRQDGFDANISAEDHIVRGSYKERKSRFISASKSRDVCLFYASKDIHERGRRLRDLRIARIDLKLDPSVQDISQSNFHRKIGICPGSTADDYARVFEEALIERSIAASEISKVEQVPAGLPVARTFREFKRELDHRRSSDGALAEALESLQI